MIALVHGLDLERDAALGARRRVPVRGTRQLSGGSMIRHGRLGQVRVEPGTGRTTLDGDLLAAAAAESVPLSRLYSYARSRAGAAARDYRLGRMLRSRVRALPPRIWWMSAAGRPRACSRLARSSSWS
jgi:hypothetical protein